MEDFPKGKSSRKPLCFDRRGTGARKSLRRVRGVISSRTLVLPLTSHLALTPGTRVGVYDITAAVGEGGMGQVYRATDARLKRQVAIKVLPPSLEGAWFSPRDDYAPFTSQESGRAEVYVTTFPDRHLVAHDRRRTGCELEWRWPRDSGRDALGAHRGLSGLDRRRLLARSAHDTRTRRRGSGSVQLGHARSFPHPHSHESGRREG